MEPIFLKGLASLVKLIIKSIKGKKNRPSQSIDNDQYEVAIEYGAKKFQADSIGHEHDVPLSQWMDIGIFGEAADDEEDRLIYLKKHKVQTGEHIIKIVVDELPVKAGIDPINILIDRNPADNVKTASEREDS